MVRIQIYSPSKYFLGAEVMVGPGNPGRPGFPVEEWRAFIPDQEEKTLFIL
jgi:hypothetical protein